MRILATAIAGSILATIAHAQLTTPEPGAFAAALKDSLSHYDVVLQPDKIEPEWWAGAPSVTRGDDGTFWMACRMRIGEGERGLRGYQLRILKSTDGAHFEQVRIIKREDVPIPGFERPALLRDAKTGLFKLYVGGPREDNTWAIYKFDDAKTPADFDLTTFHWVIEPPALEYERDQPPLSYKDPFIIHGQGQYHCYVIGYIRRNERIFHFVSPDGETWQPAENVYKPVMDLSGWHDFFIRPACVVPVGVGYFFVYEGSNTAWYDPVYNVTTGLAFTFDLHHIQDLTPDAPLLVSTTPNEHFATFRYSDWHIVGDELWIYAEVATPEKTHEIRRYVVPMVQ